MPPFIPYSFIHRENQNSNFVFVAVFLSAAENRSLRLIGAISTDIILSKNKLILNFD